MSVQSLDRAFDILELLSTQQSGLSITDISRSLDLHKSTVFRLLNSLKSREYIRQNTATLKYHIGYAFIELCSLYLSNLELKTEAEPVLRNLSKKTTQTVFLATLQENQAMYIDKVEQYNSLRKYSIIGTRTPLYCSALGKSLLTGMTNTAISDLYRESEFISVTEKTVNDLPTLIKDIEKCRERQWSFDDEENEQGVKCIASPIYDYRGKVIAAVSTSWHVKSPPDIPVEQIAEYVRDAGLEISHNMGYKPADDKFSSSQRA
ncbi:MAG: IclR family transcriptional regulator [Spirochaetes bacterium]|nr:IclR family transcriptional regulator [Spirochaetota bacterium]